MESKQFFYTYDNLNITTCPKLIEHEFMVSGQGLYNSHNIRLIGTGHNDYVIHCVNKYNQDFKIFTKDKLILEWKIRSKYEREDDEEDNFEFEAYGLINNLETQEKIFAYLYSNCGNYIN